MHFLDRIDAGRKLGAACERYRDHQPIVLGLPRGGVPVAAEVARLLGAPLDVIGVRKIGAPQQPELAIGAIGENDARFIDWSLAAQFDCDESELTPRVHEAQAQLHDRMAHIRAAVTVLDVRDRCVLIVDDGMATGSTMQAALQVVRARGAGEVVVATPVASAQAIDRCASLCDAVVVLSTPTDFGAVGSWYEHFSQTSDGEVIAALLASRRKMNGVHPQGSLFEHPTVVEQEVHIATTGPRSLQAIVAIPETAHAAIVFAHGAGSNRFSPRNAYVAKRLNDAGYATIRPDLLTPDETLEHEKGFAFIELAARLDAVVTWIQRQPALAGIPVIAYGASTGAAVAMLCASRNRAIRGVISRGGRADLVASVADQITVPCLFMTGERDDVVAELNQELVRMLGARATTVTIPRAGHLFEEPGALDAVVTATTDWLERLVTPLPANRRGV
jgi:putative phosphoribosyl transferase